MNIKMIRTKTVEEIFVEKTEIDMWHPPLKGDRCTCFTKEKEERAFPCRECYDTGVVGGFILYGLVPVISAGFEEVKESETKVKHEDSTVVLLDDFVSTFECEFHHHIYHGCIFKLENRYWKVSRMEEAEADEDNDGMPLPSRWHITARKLMEFEGPYVFLKEKEPKEEAG